MPDELVGGLLGRSLQEIHDQLHLLIDKALQEGTTFLRFKADMAKCFDRIQIDQAVEAAVALGLPKNIAATLTSFYDSQVKRVEVDGITADGSIRATRGLLQGCPASVLLLSALTFSWVGKVKKAGVHIGIFVDDRTLWSTAVDGPWRLHRAHGTGSAVDSIFGWVLHPDKNGSFSCSDSGCKRLSFFVDSLGWPSQKFEQLGIQYTFNKNEQPEPCYEKLKQKVFGKY